MTAEEGFEKLSVAIREYKKTTDNEIKELKALVAKLARENETMKPFVCKNTECKKRKVATAYRYTKNEIGNK
jgi:hypothetical protein